MFRFVCFRSVLALTDSPLCSDGEKSDLGMRASIFRSNLKKFIDCVANRYDELGNELFNSTFY